MIKLAPRLQSPDAARAPRQQPLPPMPAEPEELPEDVALTALLAAQVGAWEVEATEAVLAVADDWFRAHDASDRRYEQAVRRRSVIESRRVIQLWMVWTACCQLSWALGRMTARESWLAGNAPEIDPETVETIWRSLVGERLVPFGVVYPLPGELPIPAWQRDELSERRDRQRAKATQRATPRKKKRGVHA